MVSKEIVIQNKSGLESRVAAMFIQKANAYTSSITIEKGDRQANAKSLLGVLSLSVGKGSKVKLEINGADEEKALLELEEYLLSDWDVVV